MRKSRGVDDYVLNLEGFYKAPKSKLPNKFKKPDLEKIDEIGNPKNHLKMYVTALRPMVLENERLV